MTRHRLVFAALIACGTFVACTPVGDIAYDRIIGIRDGIYTGTVTQTMNGPADLLTDQTSGVTGFATLILEDGKYSDQTGKAHAIGDTYTFVIGTITLQATLTDINYFSNGMIANHTATMYLGNSALPGALSITLTIVSPSSINYTLQAVGQGTVEDTPVTVTLSDTGVLQLYYQSGG